MNTEFLEEIYSETQIQKQHLYRRVENPKNVNKGVTQLTLDGQLVDGNKIANLDDGKDHIVEVLLG